MAEHQTISHYKVLGQLGKGGMGVVYKALDTKLNRVVAIKILPPQFAQDERRKKRLILEAQAASSLSHPNICTIYEINEIDDTLYISMEYVQGKTLLEEIHKGPMPEHRVLEYAIQIAGALDKTHRKQVVHRDIKPSNIVINEEDQIKILDFGLARISSELTDAPLSEAPTGSRSLTEPGTVAGTVSYMAPEQISGQKADPHSDMFSFGVVLYEMLTARPPFGGHTVFEVASAILKETPEPIRTFNTAVSAGMENIVLRALEKDSHKRFPSMTDFLVALRKHRGDVLSQEIPPHRPHRWSRSFLVLAISLLLLVGLIGGLRYLSEKFPEQEAAEEAVPIRDSLIILPFKNKTGDPDLNRVRLALTQVIIDELLSSPHIRVLPYDRLYQFTDLIRDIDKEVYEAQTLKKLADYGDSQVLVQPTFLRFGNVWQILLEFQNSDTGETIDARKVIRESDGSGEKVLFDMLPDVAVEIKREMNVPIEELPTSFASVPTESAGEARIMYTEGVNHLNRGNYITAVTFLKSAIEKDPQNPLFYARIALAQKNLGYDELAQENAKLAVEKITDEVSVIQKTSIQATYDETRYNYEGAISLYQKLTKAYPDTAENYFRLGTVYEEMSFYDHALEHYDRAIQVDSGFVPAYLRKGKTLDHTNQPGEAIEVLQEALRLYSLIGNNEGRARALSAIGTVHLNQNDYGQARNFYQQAQKIDSEIENLPGLAEDYRNLGASYLLQGEVKQAMPHINAALLEFRKIGDKQSLARVHIDLGNSYIYRSMTSQARNEYNISLQIAKEIKSQHLLADCYDRLAQVSYYRKEFEDARTLGNNALEIYSKIKDRKGILTSHIGLGDLEYEVGNYGPAMNFYSQALKTSREIQDRKWIAFSLGMVGNLYYLQADYQKALENRLQELQLFHEMGNSVYAAYAGFNVAQYYVSLGAYDKALPLFQDSLRYFTDNRNKRMAGICLMNMGRLYEFRHLPGDETLAERAYQDSLGIARELQDQDEILKAEGRLALVWARSNEQKKAYDVLRDIEKKSAGGFQQKQVFTEIHLVASQLACELKRTDICLKNAEIVIETAQPLSLRAELFHAYYFVGKAELLKRKSDRALEYFQKSVALIDEVSQSLQPEYRPGFFSRPDIQNAYQDTAALLEKLGRKEEAAQIRSRLQNQTNAQTGGV